MFYELTFGELVSSLHCAPRNIEQINRIGMKVDGRIGPVRIVMRSVEAKSEVPVLKHAKLLKGTSQFSRIFIQPDLTVNQQKADKELRVKLKEIREQVEREAKIKSDKIIKKRGKRRGDNPVSTSSSESMKTVEKLRLLLINATSIMQIDKKLEIEALVTFNNYDIICVTESWASSCISDNELKIEGYTMYRRDRSSVTQHSHCAQRCAAPRGAAQIRAALL